MSFHDDSQILSQLGILDSHERSPKRDTTQTELKKFVDVKLTASVSDSEDEDDEDQVFDRNNLLLSSKRQNASLVRGRADNPTIRFMVLAFMFLTAGLVSSSSNFSTCSKRHEVIACLWICIGMLCGAYSAKLTAARSNLMLFLLATLLTLLVNLFLAINFALLYAVRGFFVGATLYGGFIVWFGFWRKEPRKLLFLLLLFATGGLLSMTAGTSAFGDATGSLADLSIVTRSIEDTVLHRVRRDTDQTDSSKILLPFSVVDNSTQPANATDDPSVKKPEVATGDVQKLKTKTEMNAEKEKEVEEKKKDTDSVVDAENATETSTTTSSSSTTTTTSTTSTTTTTTTTTTLPPTTTEIVTVDVKPRDNEKSPEVKSESLPENCPSLSLFLTGSLPAEQTSSPFIKSFCVFGVLVYFLSYCLFCLPCGLRPDSKIKKLEADSVVGLGMRLRITIAAIQTILGFVQQIKHFHGSSSSSSTEHVVICVFIVITSIILVIGGQKVGSLQCVILSFTIAAFGEIILLFSYSSSFGIIVSVCGLYSLWISLFLVVEIVLQVRSTVQLAYFLIAWIVGRAIACLFVLEPIFEGTDHAVTLIFTVIIGIAVYYAVRMLVKSKRLKEILDNSSAPISAGISSGEGEYISLTAQDVLDDDDLLDEDEMDRSSMDLDFELEQLGLEPVGAGSRA